MRRARCCPSANRRARPTQGIVTVRTSGGKADGTVFMKFERTVLVPMSDPA